MGANESTPINEQLENIRTLADRAVNAVDIALAAIPIKGLSQTTVAERAIVRLRDALIEQLRQSPDKDGGYRGPLERANAALSIVVGVEYPQTPNQRAALEMARNSLKQAVDELPASR